MTIEELYNTEDKTLVQEWKTCPEGVSFSMAGEHHKVWNVDGKLYHEVSVNGGATLREMKPPVKRALTVEEAFDIVCARYKDALEEMSKDD